MLGGIDKKVVNIDINWLDSQFCKWFNFRQQQQQHLHYQQQQLAIPQLVLQLLVRRRRGLFQTNPLKVKGIRKEKERHNGLLTKHYYIGKTLLLGHEMADMIMPSSSSREDKAINLDQSPNPNQITDLNQVFKAFSDRQNVLI